MYYTFINIAAHRATVLEAITEESKDMTAVTAGTGVHAGVKDTHSTPPIPKTVSSISEETRPMMMKVGWDYNRGWWVDLGERVNSGLKIGYL